jgi:outer membrane protein assembly factor BamB
MRSHLTPLRALAAFLVAATAASARAEFEVPMVFSVDQNIYRLDLSTGIEEIVLPGTIQAFRQLEASEAALYGTNNDPAGVDVSRVDLQGGTLELLARFREPFPTAFGVALGQALYIAVEDASGGLDLLVLDPNDGQLLWQAPLAVPSSRALATRDGDLWVITWTPPDSTSLYRVAPETGEILQTVTIPGGILVRDADFARDGGLWVSEWHEESPGEGCARYHRIDLESQSHVLWLSDCQMRPGFPFLNFAVDVGVGAPQSPLEVPSLAFYGEAILGLILAALATTHLRRLQ